MVVLMYLFMAFFLGVSLLMLIAAQDLSFQNAAIPRTAALVILILGVIELIKMWKQRRYESLALSNGQFWKVFHQKALVICWLVFTVLAIYLIGFIYGIFLSGFVFFRFFYFRSFLKAALAAFVIGGFVYLAFVRLAGFTLYEGNLLG